MNELRDVMKVYEENHLPGACGSIDVVHVKWLNCPTGDHNRAKGKASYPTMAFEVITDNDRKIFAIGSAQFGTRNDKHIVKLDHNVSRIRTGWYNKVRWQFTDGEGEKQTDCGVYLICDGGYLQWPELICPFKHPIAGSDMCYFSTNLESVRKDVECVFGILKKRWRILDNGIRFRNMRVGEMVFVSCCVLHNMMLSEMEQDAQPPRVRRSSIPIDDALWIKGATPVPPLQKGQRANAIKWGQRRAALGPIFAWSGRHRRGHDGLKLEI
ncbi:hypothetical protein ACHAWF_001665 [Thalassiosira exigua]